MNFSIVNRSLYYTNEARLLLKINLYKIIPSLSFNKRTSYQASTAVSSSKDQKYYQKKKINVAMKAHLERAVAREHFLTQKATEYEIGKRHLANMMGENPETFTQNDIDNAIHYLFPSGLYNKRALPIMKHPSLVYPPKEEAKFDYYGRPFHSLFYTLRPQFYSLVREISFKYAALDKIMKNSSVMLTSKLDLGGSKWITNEQLVEMVQESLHIDAYPQIIQYLDRLSDHPLAEREKDFIMKFRIVTERGIAAEEIPPLMYTSEGIPYITAKGRRRKAYAEVTVYGKGRGHFTVNGEDILYFKDRQERYQILFPLQMAGVVQSVDVEATASGGGLSGQAGAIRYAMASALKSFVSSETIDKMRIAGLLTKDIRRRERKKPGQKGARAKFPWRKR